MLNRGFNGCASPSFGIVNAEDSSMGEVVECGIGIVDDTSPRKVAIGNVQAELIQKCTVRDETRRELEFLEKGGNLLDYNPQSVASVSVQSTSYTDRHNRLVVNSALSHGDSVESSGEPGVVPSEANSADNLMLSDAENKLSEGGRTRSLSHPCRSNFVTKELLPNINKTRKHSDSTAATLPGKAYKRRNRSRPSREGARSSSTNVEPAQGCHYTTLSCPHGFRDVKNSESEGDQKDTKLVGMLHSVDPVKVILVKNETSCESRLNDLDGSKSENHGEGVSQPTQLEHTDSSNPLHEQLNQDEQTIAERSPTRVGPDGDLEMNGLEKEKVDESNDAHRSMGPHVVKLNYPEAGRNIGGSNSNELLPTVHVDASEIIKNLTFDEADIHTSETLKKDYERSGISRPFKQEDDLGSQNPSENGSLIQSMERLAKNVSSVSNRELEEVTVEKFDKSVSDLSEFNRECVESFEAYENVHNETTCPVSSQEYADSRVLSEGKPSFTDQLSAGIIHEDSILKEAEIIEAKRKKISEFSVVTSPKKFRQRSQWDYVLEEMTWLSNDFAQERMWKIAAAAQMSSKVAVAWRLRREAKSSSMDAKRVARTLAKAVLDFWDSVRVEGSNELMGQKSSSRPIRTYAARIVISHKPSTDFNQEIIPLRQDGASELGQPVMPEDNISYDLFYTVPPAAMETYIKSIMSHLAQLAKVGSYLLEEAEASACDDFESQDNDYYEDEGETSTYNLPAAFESTISSRNGRKKMKLERGRSYEISSELLPLQRSEVKLVNRESGSPEKRPGRSLQASGPTKRVRTASRRVISSFSTGPSGSFQLNKADASSGDTSSLPDDLSTHSGLDYPNTLEAESAGFFEKHSPYNTAELSVMPKKKKAKHMNTAYDQQWQGDSGFHEEQKDRCKRRFENLLPQSNGSSGLYGQTMLKKPKVLRQSRDYSFESPSQIGASVLSPVASRFSNMHNPNKFAKMLGVRDRGRKVKGPKMPTAQPGSGSLWSVFEDQALVVLVHDFGPNWQLISDAFNNALHFKSAFRNAKECKERHYTLMDRGTGDGADSADDSGSSQPYPSALPGIPKGSARLLFQRLQGPVEEDVLKSHFEKMIMIGQKMLPRRTKDPKQLQPPHSSHAAALSQAFPNNLSGNPILTPLDLCDVAQSPDVFQTQIGMQVENTGGSALPNQRMTNSLLPASGARYAFQGSPNVASAANFPSSPGTVNASGRDERHVIPDEQLKLQHYNQLMVGRNVSQASLPSPNGGSDRGVRVNASSTAMGVSSNRAFPMARPGSQVNSGDMVSPAASPNMHTGLATGCGSPIPRSHDALQLMRPGMGQMMPDLYMPGGSQGMPHRNQASPQQPQANSPRAYFQGPHAPNLQQQSFGPRLAKERQRMLQQSQQQHQKFASSNNNLGPQPQLQGPQVQSPRGSAVSLSPLPSSSSMNSMPQHQQKQQASAVGAVQNAQTGGANHTGKQQSRQQHSSQPNRQHPQRPLLQPQQQVKVVKGRGKVLLHPNNSSVSNGVSASPVEKLEAGSHLNQGLAVSSMQLTKGLSQQRISSGQGSSASKHIQTPQSDSSSQLLASPPAPPVANFTHQSAQSSVVSLSNGQHLLPHQNLPLSHITKSAPDVSPARQDSWHASELLSDGALHSSSISYEPMPQEGQVLDQRPSTTKHDVDAQCQQQQPQSPGSEKQQSSVSAEAP